MKAPNPPGTAMVVLALLSGFSAGVNDHITCRLMKDIDWSVNLIFKDGFRSGNDNFWSSTSP